MSGKKLILIDGNSLLFRAFFALPVSIATSSGQVTNAVYGFTAMLLKLLKEERPDAIAVAFDRAAPTFRHEAYKGYKAHRAEIPEDLPSQFPLTKEVLNVLRIPVYEIDGYEADDILSFMARKGSKTGYDVTIVTGDKDALQLVSPHIKVMTTRKGITDTYTYDRSRVVDRYGIAPEQIPDFIGLKGDPSDNIPGVPGIGEKTAGKLLQEFGSLEDIYKDIDKVKQPKLRQTLIDNEEQARMSKELGTMVESVPIDIDMEGLKVGDADKDEVRKLFGKLEFRTLLSRLEEITRKDVAAESQAGKDKEAGHPPMSFRGEAISGQVELSEQDFKKRYAREETGFVLVKNDHRIDAEVVFSDGMYKGSVNSELLREYLESRKAKKVCHDSKEAFHTLRHGGIGLEGVVFDTMIAAYLVYPGRKAYDLAGLSVEYTGASNPSVILKLKDALETEMAARGVSDLFYDIEMPLSRVLAEMEEFGVAIDAARLETLSERLSASLASLEDEIYHLAGGEFNVNSPQQLSAVLFEKLGMKPEKKTKTGYSTDVSVLMKLKDEHPIVDKILSFRELAKMKSTYMDALPPMIDPETGRIHTNFNQVGTSTGRLASEKPNLQNIPVRGEWGARIREAFIPGREGWSIMSADYSQIELRVLAHMSEDEKLLEAFERGEDIHTATAEAMMGIEKKDITPDHRRVAKAINFGLVYGMSSFGLAAQLGIDESEARGYIDKYFEQYPTVRGFIDTVVEEAKSQGFVRTLLGRIRYIPELSAGDYNTRRLGERLAINTKIQGTAADIIKVAMIEIDKQLKEYSYKTRMILQIHDELVFEVPKDELEKTKTLVIYQMENARKLKAPLAVNVGVGENWAEAHG